jgi:hypothetical protein
LSLYIGSIFLVFGIAGENQCHLFFVLLSVKNLFADNASFDVFEIGLLFSDGGLDFTEKISFAFLE